jgi:hypothetical protein
MRLKMRRKTQPLEIAFIHSFIHETRYKEDSRKNKTYFNLIASQGNLSSKIANFNLQPILWYGWIFNFPDSKETARNQQGRR